MIPVRIVESIFDGDIGTLICALFPFAIATWWIIRVHILPARKWKPPPGLTERTNFYRKKKALDEHRPPTRNH